MRKRATIGEQIKDAVTRDLVNAFASLAYYAARDAYRNHTYKHRTYALHDSYGSAVYLDGRLVPETIRYVNRSRQTRNDWRGFRGSKTPEVASPKEWVSGRKSLEEFLKNPSKKGLKRKGITMLVVVAQWYASIVEGKGYSVLDNRVVGSSIAYRFDSMVTPILNKYGLKKIAYNIKRDLGIDQFYVQDMAWRRKHRRG